MAHIPTLKHRDGRIFADSSNINSIFQDFYRTLYTYQRDESNREAGMKFLSRVRLPVASPDMLGLLNADITDFEIQLTIKKLGLGKAPGPDGYTSEFYKLLREQI